jgi:hypothetical protein
MKNGSYFAQPAMLIALTLPLMSGTVEQNFASRTSLAGLSLLKS